MREHAADLMRFTRRARGDFQRFFALESAGAVILFIAALAAIVLASSSLAERVAHFWEVRLAVSLGSWSFGQSLRHWVDDGLMALFFFVVGLEIKRELIAGELSGLRKAALPIIAALGGMALPALIYLALNGGSPGASGWGVPMATDIAFALGVLALLGSAVPVGLRVFLAALAIADDIGAILVIAVFYTESVSWRWLAVGLVLLVLLAVLNRLGVDSPLPYLGVGLVVWFAFLHSGVHATIAGVLVAMTIPSRSRISPLDFVSFARTKLDEIEACDVPGAHVLEDAVQQECAFEVREAAAHSAAPLQRLEHALHPLSTFVILPVFALANAGIPLASIDLGGLLTDRVALGIFFGLVAGKTLGVSLFTWLAVRMRVADLPTGVGWTHIVGVGLIAGIGFTMSLFVSNLAFTEDALLTGAKAAILLTSAVAGLSGYAVLRLAVGGHLRGNRLSGEGA